MRNRIAGTGELRSTRTMITVWSRKFTRRSIRIIRTLDMPTSAGCLRRGRNYSPSTPLCLSLMMRRADMKLPPALPADIGTALAQPEWRRKVSWPVGLAQTNGICVQQVRDALAWSQQIDDQLLRDATTLALPVLLA